MNNIATWKKAVLITALMLVAALAARGIQALTKQEWHIDEGITLMLTNGNWMPGLDMADHDEWLTGADMRQQTMSARINSRSAPEIGKIVEATAADVHPPLYYWLFAIARKIMPVRDGIPAGYALNACFFVISLLIFSRLAWKAFPDPIVFACSLGIFALSSATVSLTVFLRMYELLQMLCLAFLAGAWAVLFPARRGLIGTSNVAGSASPAGRAGAWIGIAILFITTFFGLITQYYFIFFALPVCAFAFVWLIVDRRPADLLWSVLAVAVAGYLAYKFFPTMGEHLTKSYRAKQSLQNLSGVLSLHWLESIVLYALIVGKCLVPLAGLAALAILIVVSRRVSSRAAEGGAKPDSQTVSRSGKVKAFIASLTEEGAESTRERRAITPVVALFLFIFFVTFFIIAFSAPYRTARYVVSFSAAYTLAFVLLAVRLLPIRMARLLVAIVAVAVAVHGILPSTRCDFHEDYYLGDDTSFMRDGKPLILMGSPDGTWKTPLVYLNIPDAKRIYSTRAALDADVTGRLQAIARSSGEDEAYALVCDYIGTEPRFEKIGYYGFYNVYRVPAR